MSTTRKRSRVRQPGYKQQTRSNAKKQDTGGGRAPAARRLAGTIIDFGYSDKEHLDLLLTIVEQQKKQKGGNNE